MVLNFFKKRPNEDKKSNSSVSEQKSEISGANNGENRHRPNRESDQKPYSNRQSNSYGDKSNYSGSKGTASTEELSTAVGRKDPSKPNPRPGSRPTNSTERRPAARPSNNRESNNGERRPAARPYANSERNSTQSRPVQRPISNRESITSESKPVVKRPFGYIDPSDRRPAAKPSDRRPASSSAQKPSTRPFGYRDPSEQKPSTRPFGYRDPSEQKPAARTTSNRPYGEANRTSSAKPFGQRSTGARPTNSRPTNNKNAKSNTATKKPFIPKPGPDITEPMRLNKYIANTGLCSRRESDEYIKAGHITVNEIVVTEMGMRVKPGDLVKYRGSEIQPESKTYIIMNKPKDFVTTVDDPNAKKTVLDLVQGKIHQRVYPVGRLDRNTTGVLLLTNDGELTKQLTHPKYNKKKIYHVHLDKAISEEDLVKIKEGFDLEDGFINADDISYVDINNKMEVGIEVHSGKNRIIRRIFHHLDYKVTRLDRVYFAGLTKLGLSRSKWRFLTNHEIATLKTNAYK